MASKLDGLLMCAIQAYVRCEVGYDSDDPMADKTYYARKSRAEESIRSFVSALKLEMRQQALTTPAQEGEE